MRVKNILGDKGHEVVTVPPDATVGDVVGLLEKERIGAVVVSPDGEHVDGIVSETDIVRTLAREGRGASGSTGVHAHRRAGHALLARG